MEDRLTTSAIVMTRNMRVVRAMGSATSHRLHHVENTVESPVVDEGAVLLLLPLHPIDVLVL